MASSTNLAKVNHGEGMQPYNAFTPAPAQPAAPPANPMLVNAYRNANLPPQMPNAMPFAMPQMGSYAMTAPPGMWGGQPTNLMPPSETLVPVHGYDIPAQPTQLPLQPVGYQTPATPGFVQASNQAMDRPTSLVATPNSMGNAQVLDSVGADDQGLAPSVAASWRSTASQLLTGVLIPKSLGCSIRSR